MRFLLLTLLLVGGTTTLSSCSGDDDEVIIDYYLNISSKESIGVSSADEEQGTMGEPNSNVLANTIMKMKTALRESYPVPNTQGNDVDVSTACDKIYYDYKSMYGALEKNTICVVKLYRVNKIDDIIRGSTSLRVYHFGVIPPAQE